jgi:hypothetical protein
LTEPTDLPLDAAGGDDADRRRYRRFPANVEIHFRTLDVQGKAREHVGSGQTRDISDMGLSMALPASFLAGTLLELRFKVNPEDREVHAVARVAWCSQETGETRCGIDILRLNSDEKREVILQAKRGCWVEGGKRVKRPSSGV